MAKREVSILFGTHDQEDAKRVIALLGEYLEGYTDKTADPVSVMAIAVYSRTPSGEAHGVALLGPNLPPAAEAMARALVEPLAEEVPDVPEEIWAHMTFGIHTALAELGEAYAQGTRCIRMPVTVGLVAMPNEDDRPSGGTSKIFN